MIEDRLEERFIPSPAKLVKFVNEIGQVKEVRLNRKQRRLLKIGVRR